MTDKRGLKIIMTGATGFTGGETLKQALADTTIEQVIVLTRRSVGFAHPRLKEIILDNFLDYSSLDLSDCDACIWCLGVSQLQVGPEAYVRITLDYTLAAARAMFAVNPGLRFCFVSGRSADPTEKNPTPFARIKGRTERMLSELGGSVFSFRPGYIRASAQSVPRKDFGRLFAPIATLVSLFNEDYSVDCDQLARCLLDVAKYGIVQNAEHVLVNRVIRSWKQRA